MEKIAVVVPTIRPESFTKFKEVWGTLFKKHKITLVAVLDGNSPTIEVYNFKSAEGTTHMTIARADFSRHSLEEVMGDYTDLIFNLNDGVRNLGFAFAYRNLKADIIISLDDDTEPEGDTIQDHLDALSKRYPIQWMNTADEVYLRGFPYMIRGQAECVLSHGVWHGVADFDASTQLVLGTPELTYRKMPVPQGVLFPMCIMNVAMKRKAVPFMYQAPMAYKLELEHNIKDLNRFADIWAGIAAKRDIDKNDLCAVTGFAAVNHKRASNPFVNLVKEAQGVAMNEVYGVGPYFALFEEKRKRWQEFLNK